MAKLTSVITGVTGQDGAYLAQQLLDSGHRVIGTSSRNPQPKLWRLKALGVCEHENFNLSDWDITNPKQTNDRVSEIRPDFIFNLASHSFVGQSLNNPYDSAMVTGVATVNLLEAIAQFSTNTKLLVAGSSEMFGLAETAPQSELSRFSPRNIYGSSKVFAHLASLNYRAGNAEFSSTAILFNHESPLRGPEFVTRKVTKTVAKIKYGHASKLLLGNLSSERDWGYAPEYVSAMRKIMDYEQPETFVVATGKSTTVRDFVRMSFAAASMEVEFSGNGLDEVGYEVKSGRELVSVYPEHFRPTEAVPLIGDPRKAESLIGWKAKVDVQEIAGKMVESDLYAAREGMGN